ncbi:hypothetical protein F5X97DRAFT_317757 [Nemania serpens]|nr:hypothetical protein F5X97DRAFT_317757 [Nemania serpens]
MSDERLVASPESDVSPCSQSTVKGDYFSLAKTQAPTAIDDAQRNTCTSLVRARPPVALVIGNQGRETDNTGDASATTPGETASSSGSSALDSRKGSLGNVTFQAPHNPSLPQGLKKPHGGSRIRDASPPHRRIKRLGGISGIGGVSGRQHKLCGPPGKQEPSVQKLDSRPRLTARGLPIPTDRPLNGQGVDKISRLSPRPGRMTLDGLNLNSDKRHLARFASHSSSPRL